MLSQTPLAVSFFPLFPPPLRIQPCANVGHGPHYRNTFAVQQYRALLLFVYVYSMLLRAVKSLKSRDCGRPSKSGSFINRSEEKWHQAVKSFCALTGAFTLYCGRPDLELRIRKVLRDLPVWSHGMFSVIHSFVLHPKERTGGASLMSKPS